MSESPVQLILDSTALAAYGHNATVGELLNEVEDEELTVLCSTGSLAQALAVDTDRALLELLLQRDSCTAVSPLTEWERFADFLRFVGPGHDVHDAYLVMLAFQHRAYILTTDPGRYRAVHKAVWCIQLQNPWTDGATG